MLRRDVGSNFSEASTRSSAAYETQCHAPMEVGHRRWRHVNQLKSRRCWCVRHGRVVFVIVRSFCHCPYRQALLSWLWRDVLRERFVAGVECRGPLQTVSRKSSSLWARKRRQPVVHTWFLSQRSVTARPPHSAEDCRRHALFMTMSSKWSPAPGCSS